MASGKTPARVLAYNQLRDMILNGELHANAVIDEPAIAAKLQISRTPVREALYQLESEGFIKLVHNKGAIVTDLDIGRIIDIYQVREALEGMAARACVNFVNQARLLQIKEELLAITAYDQEADRERAYALGREIHREIRDCVGNQLLIDLLETVYIQNSRITAKCLRLDTRCETIKYQHIDIIDAVLSKDPNAAEKAMRNHIIDIAREILATYQPSYL